MAGLVVGTSQESYYVGLRSVWHSNELGVGAMLNHRLCFEVLPLASVAPIGQLALFTDWF